MGSWVPPLGLSYGHCAAHTNRPTRSAAHRNQLIGMPKMRPRNKLRLQGSFTVVSFHWVLSLFRRVIAERHSFRLMCPCSRSRWSCQRVGLMLHVERASRDQTAGNEAVIPSQRFDANMSGTSPAPCALYAAWSQSPWNHTE